MIAWRINLAEKENRMKYLITLIGLVIIAANIHANPKALFNIVGGAVGGQALTLGFIGFLYKAED